MKSLVSKYLSVNTYDFLKAGIISAIYTLLDAVETYFANNHSLPDTTQLKAMLIQSGIVFVAYIKLKAFTNSDGKVFTKEPPAAPIEVPAPAEPPTEINQ